MSIMHAELYDALVIAGAPPEKAREAAMAIPIPDNLATKIDMEKIQARMSEMVTKGDLEKIWTRISEMATKDDLEKIWTRISEMATKDDLEKIQIRIADMVTKNEMNARIAELEVRLVRWIFVMQGITISILVALKLFA